MTPIKTGGSVAFFVAALFISLPECAAEDRPVQRKPLPEQSVRQPRR